LLRRIGKVDPASLDDYRAAGGYDALRTAVKLGPDGVVRELKDAKLMGRGGAAFPTGVKWEAVAKQPVRPHYFICNADESEPGTFKDRVIMEEDPYAVVEAMTIAGMATGCERGYLYIRGEYPLATSRLQHAISEARAHNLLGLNILGRGLSFDIEIRRGGGAYICGEETAVFESIEGKRGYPHPRPPYPSIKGLWDKPTCINNVETLANIPVIFLKGGKWFAGIGYEKSKGTKVFALTGKVKKSGLVEVPMGTTLREIVFDIGGGAANGKKVKAIQTGGPSGGVIPREHFDTPVSYENLQMLGSIMGSGGMIVMDEDDSMVDIAKFYLGFCVDESCGKCAPCRIGGKQMLGYLEKITEGRGAPEDLDKLRTISYAMQKASLCGLGQTAPNPVLSTLRYFENEYKEKMAR